MATLKIYQSQSQVKQPGDMQTGGSVIPVSLATQLGKGLGSVGKVITDIKKDQKKEEDKNEAADIITGINSSISEKFNKYKRSTRIEDVNSFSNDMMGIEFEASNNNVKKTVNKYLRDQRLDLGLKLSNKIIGNSYDKSKLNKDNDLNDMISKMASDDEKTRLIANKRYEIFFNDPAEKFFYGETEFAKLKKEKDKLKLSTILIQRINNNEVDLTDKKQRDKIIEIFGVDGAKPYLDRIRNKNVAIEIQKDNEQRKQEKATVEQQLNNFTDILGQINLTELDTTKQPVTLDQIYDYYQDGKLNTVQYNSLIKIYSDPSKTSNADIQELISTQIAYANDAKTLDDIQKSIHSDKNVIEGLSPQDFITYKSLIDKYGKDVVGLQDYKKFQEQLKSHVGDVQNALISFNNTDAAADRKDAAQKAIADFTRYVNDGFSPADAYLKAVNNFTDTKKLPKIEKLELPTSINIDAKLLEEKIANDPFYRKTLYKDAVELFKKNNSISDYRENIRRLDILFDVYEIRRSLGANKKKTVLSEGGTE